MSNSETTDTPGDDAGGHPDGGADDDPDCEPASETESATESVTESEPVGRFWPLVMTLLAWGSGQAALGHRRRGFMWLVALGLWPLLVSIAPFALFLWPALVIAALVDVWRLAPDREAMAAGARPLAFFIGFLAMAAASMGAMKSWVSESFKVPAASMAPTLEVGDRFLISKTSYWFSGPERGDVVVFENPCEPETDFVKRIVAVGGDTIELRCNRLYINGELTPEEPVPDRCTYQDAYQMRSCSRYRETIDGRSHDTVYHEDRPAEDAQRARASEELRYHLTAPLRDFPDLRSGVPAMPRCWDDTSGGGSALAPGVIENSSPERDTYSDRGICAPQVRYRVPEGHYFTLGDNRDNSHDSRVWGSVPGVLIKGKATMVWFAEDRSGDTKWGRVGTRLD